MVLVLKHWKSRSSPGIKAGGHAGNKPIHSFKKAAAGLTRAAAFSSLDQSSKDIGTAGWSSPVARQAHNLKVVGSNPTPATNLIKPRFCGAFLLSVIRPPNGKLSFQTL